MAAVQEESKHNDQGDFTGDPWKESKRPRGTLHRKKKVQEVLKSVQDSKAVADLRMTLYVAACDALAEGRPMKPFPPGHWDTGWGCKLWAVNEAVPAMNTLEAQLETKPDSLGSDVLDALHWVLVSAAGSKIEEAHLSDLPASLRALALPPPTTVFTVRQTEPSTGSTKLGCYTGPLDQFHTLLHCGPAGLSGLSLYDSLISCLACTRPSWCWNKSDFAPKPALVGVVEFPAEPSILRKLKSSKRKVYVIQDPSKCRLRYILLYSEPAVTRLPTQTTNPPFCFVKWIKNHYYAGSSVLVLLATLIYSLFK